MSSTTTVAAAVIDHLREGLGSHCRQSVTAIVGPIRGGRVGSCRRRCRLWQEPQPPLSLTPSAWERSGATVAVSVLDRIRNGRSRGSAWERSGAAAAVSVLDRIFDGRSWVPPPPPSLTPSAIS
ncbi:hypothetical protein [Oryza sativa Japonica Group]|uniref:Uncharacterized protein n=1 Tax=Oryza sativa subsp. japonica TaxID=39947 RepID=Q5QME2_ORYSJ|nr:hypothetical protein [Oryza sativa Japonica Group]